MFEGPNGTGNGDGPHIDFAQRISGFFVPTTTDTYTFFTDSDDDSDFFISTDASTANKRLVAQETTWAGVRNWVSSGGSVSQKRSDQWSPDGGVTIPYQSGILLNSGQKYYMEQVHHNGAGGGTHATATFKGSADPDPVNGDPTRFVTNKIGMYVPRIQWVAFLQQPTNGTVISGGNSVTFTVAGTNDPSPLIIGTTDNPLLFIHNAASAPLQYQWYKDGTPISGANGSSYTLPFALPSDQGAQFVCGLRALGYADNSLNRIYSNSAPAVLTVVTDTVPPTLSYAATFENTNLVPSQFIVNVTFSKWMNGTQLSNATYTVSGATVTNVIVASNHRTVQLLLNQMPTSPLTVNVSGVITDLSGNALSGSSTIAINAEKLNFSDVGTPGTDPAYPSFVWIDGNGDYIVTAQGSDIWGNADGFNFGWELKTNDFDVVVRGVSETPTSQWAKMGLMVRETLDANSREWSIVNEPLAADGGNNQVDTNMRDTTGGGSAGWKLTSAALPPPSYPNAWLRLKRTGSTLDGFYSTNGANWVLATSYNTATNATPLGAEVLVGICTTAHNNDVVSNPPPSPFRYYNTAEYANYNSTFVAVAAGASLSVSVSGTNVIVSWTPTGGHLEASPALSAPGVNWQTVIGSSPVSVPIGTTNQFFRVVNP
jgi:hypothetical protein